MRFQGKTAIVTGGASGIGLAITKGLVAEGAQVLATDYSQEFLDALEDAPGLHKFQADLTAPGGPEAVVEAAKQLTGRIDIVVGSAGVASWTPAHKVSDAEWDNCLALNLTANLKLARALGEVMIPQRSGALLFVASMAGLAGIPNAVGYVASKHGVVGLTRSLAVDWAKYGLRVNALCPGVTETEMVRKGREAQPEGFKERVARIPLGRTASTDEQASVALFLVSDDASYVSGLIANNDAGGYALYSGWASPAISKAD